MRALNRSAMGMQFIVLVEQRHPGFIEFVPNTPATHSVAFIFAVGNCTTAFVFVILLMVMLCASVLRLIPSGFGRRIE